MDDAPRDRSVTLTVSMPLSMAADLERVAETKGRTSSWVVRDALSRYLYPSRQGLVPPKGMTWTEEE
jgi:hypothetical protein